MASSIIILVTRTVRLRGGRSIPRGLVTVQRTQDGWVVAHPSGIEGALAFIPAAYAEEVIA